MNILMGVTKQIGGLGLVALAMPAFAQTVPSTSIAPPTREEVQRGNAAPSALPPSRLTVEGGVERAPCPLGEPRFANVTLTIKGAQFDNLRGLPPEALAPAYESLIGKTVPIATICEMRDAAATILRRAGYLAAVQVPPQHIADGIVHFDVLMAKLVRVQVRGNAGRSERLLAAYLDKLVGQPLFNEKDAERYLLLARDLPGYDVHLVLRPAGTVPGEVVGEVSVTRQPFMLSANIQNYGSHSVGRWGALLTGQANDVIGMGDRLTLGLFNTVQTHEQTVLQAGYDVRVGGEGLTLGGRFTYAWTRPDLGFDEHPLKSRTLVASLEASYPFRRSQSIDVRGAGGIDLINQDLDFLDNALTRDRLRVAYARLDFGAVDPDSIAGLRGLSAVAPRWRLTGSLEFRHGLGILDATRDCGPAPYVACTVRPTPSRIQGNPQGTLVRFSGQAELRPGGYISFALSPRLQYSFTPLLSYEQYSGGNYTIGRGYDPGAVVGDSGAGASAEIRFGEVTPGSSRSLAFQPYGFVDAAWVWNHDATSAVTERDRLLSAGAGIRIAWGDHARIDLLGAAPLHRPATQERKEGARVLLSLTTRLLPWTIR
ncbi:ShlB/FhaC/HecB family hemolysin secretion/activation protein [Sphingomonas sp. MMS24-J13]|uniref:ShlB/FhaC/HecB family hemolysin secretion/activation protein n=1 Tax=Sphingomonas sp. MMS24-J13 TaxID=3238686 RepID=UPI0038500C64